MFSQGGIGTPNHFWPYFSRVEEHVDDVVYQETP